MRNLIAGVFAAGIVLLALPAAAATTPTWPGTWQTSWGPLTLTASGNGFAGVFGYSDSHNEPLGHLKDVKADGAVLSGSWSHDPPSPFAPRDHGTFRVTWSLEGGIAKFDGTATYTADGTTTEWFGSCKSGACAADTVAPTVKALGASGKRGARVTLRWQVSDAGGTTTDLLTVYKGAKKLWTYRTTHAVKAGETYFTSFRAPKAAGTLRFVVVSTDTAGNRRTSTASIRIT